MMGSILSSYQDFELYYFRKENDVIRISFLYIIDINILILTLVNFPEQFSFNCQMRK